MIRAEKDLQTKLRGNQFRGVNNSEKLHEKGFEKRAQQFAFRKMHREAQEHNTNFLHGTICNNILKVLNLK